MREVPLTKDGTALPRQKKLKLFVIIAESKAAKEAGIRYIGNDGSTTTLKSVAARFWTFWGAKEFAELNQIALNARTYIDREEFETQG